VNPARPWLGGGYPQLCRDVNRNLARAARALAGLDAAVTFDRDPAVLAAARPEVTAARAARLAGTGRPADPDGWAATWGQAAELVTLRAGGELAGWLLAAAGAGDTYRVLAAQMAGPFAGARPGYACDALAMARAMAGPAPWPPLPDLIEALCKAAPVTLAGGGYRPYQWLYWGEGHPGKLLTRPGR
jgi:hypothetical protein